MTAPVTLWSKTNENGDTVLIANADKTAIVECTTCPCDDEGLIWDITIGAGVTYRIDLYIFGNPATGGRGRAIIDWGDGNRTTTSLVMTGGIASSHLYVEGGTYTVTIRGDVMDFTHTGTNVNLPVLVRMLNLRSFTGTSSSYFKFKDCPNITAIAPGCLFSEAFWGGASMFHGCTGLTTIPNITFPLASGVQYLDLKEMFSGCSALTSVGRITISNSVSIRMDSMFEGAGITVLPEFVFPARVPGLVADYAFASCSSLTGVVSEDTPCTFAFPGTTDGALLANYMFWDCSALTTAPTLVFPTSVGGNCNLSRMFAADSALSADLYLLFPKSVGGDFNAYAMFSGCASLGSATLLHFPQSVTNSFTTTFMFQGSGLEEITAMVFPSSVGSQFVLEKMFEKCVNLHTIPTLDFTLGNAVGSFKATNMFLTCPALTGHVSLLFPDIVTGTFTIDYMFASANITGINTLGFPSRTGNFIATSAFRRCPALSTIPALDFPATVTGNFTAGYMFAECSKLVRIPPVTFPHAITGGFNIVFMFGGCKKVTEVLYPWYFPSSFTGPASVGSDVISSYEVNTWSYFQAHCVGSVSPYLCQLEGYYDSSNHLPHGYHPPFWNIVESGPILLGCSNVCLAPLTYWDAVSREYTCN